ncbi:hypothetical protein, partial [Mycolicibacterium insubricum]|uniref:hypothetical protein n=1 Tax=Mycolicibacterium insubricum TaxID=444597 RepID=UPI0021F330EF
MASRAHLRTAESSVLPAARSFSPAFGGAVGAELSARLVEVERAGYRAADRIDAREGCAGDRRDLPVVG